VGAFWTWFVQRKMGRDAAPYGVLPDTPRGVMPGALAMAVPRAAVALSSIAAGIFVPAYPSTCLSLSLLLQFAAALVRVCASLNVLRSTWFTTASVHLWPRSFSPRFHCVRLPFRCAYYHLYLPFLAAMPANAFCYHYGSAFLWHASGATTKEQENAWRVPFAGSACSSAPLTCAWAGGRAAGGRRWRAGNRHARCLR